MHLISDVLGESSFSCEDYLAFDNEDIILDVGEDGCTEV